MKRLTFVFFALTLCLAVASCGKEYDDTELKGKVDKLTEEVNTLKANQQAMQAVIDVWKSGGYVQSIDNSVPGQHTITFYGENGKVVVIYDGANGQAGAQGPQGPQGPEGPQGAAGDSFFKSVVTTEDGVTFTLSDETSFTIPFAKAFKLVIDNPEAMVEAGVPVEFPYTVKNANATTSVDVFAGGNYAAYVNAGASKIVVTPPTPAVDGNVLAWAQNDEGLFSMVKLKFLVTADTQIVTEPEVYQAIPKAGGDVVLDVVSNVDIIVPSPDVDWVTVSLTKASYKLTLTVTENTTGEPRELVMKILRADNNEQVQEFKIIQLATAPAAKETKVTKLWEKISGDTEQGITGSWLASLSVGGKTGTAQGDRNMTMDRNYVYVAEFNSSKNIWAIGVDDPTNVKLLPTTSVKDAGLANNYLSCARAIRNTNATYNGGNDVLIVSNLSQDGGAWLYVYDNGIEAEPRVVEMKNAAGRLGDTFTALGDYEHCMLTFGKHAGNGFVHFQLPVTGTSTSLQNRYQIQEGGADKNIDGFPAFFCFPGDLTKGVYARRGEYRAMYAEAATTNEKVWTEWDVKYNTPAVKLHYGSDTDNANGFATGYNFLEFNGKRYVIYGRYPTAGTAELVIREGELTDDWTTIMGLDGGTAPKARFFSEKFVTKNTDFVSGNTGLDVAVYQRSETEVLIAIDKQNVGLVVYKMTAE